MQSRDSVTFAELGLRRSRSDAPYHPQNKKTMRPKSRDNGRLRWVVIADSRARCAEGDREIRPRRRRRVAWARTRRAARGRATRKRPRERPTRTAEWFVFDCEL